MSEPAFDREAFALLRGIDVLASLPDDVLAAAAAHLTPVALAAGEALVRLGERADALYIVADGEMEVRLPGPDGERLIAVLGRGRGIGEMQMVSGGTRTASVYARGPARAWRLAREVFGRFAAEHPEALQAIVQRVRERAQDAAVAALIPQVCGELPAEAVETLRARVRWVDLRRGQALFHQGDPGDAWYIVASGRLEIVIADPDGAERIVGEASRGDSLGELALLTGEPRAATPWAVRDTSLLRIDRQDFDDIVVRRPEVMLAIVRALARRLQEQGRAKPRGFGQHFAVVGARPGVGLAEVARRLVEAFRPLGSVLHVNPAVLAAAGVMDGADKLADDHPAWLRWQAWLDEQDLVYDHLVFEGLEDGGVWDTRIVRQADHVLLVGRAGDDPAPTDVERRLEEATKPRGVRRTLILLHPDGARPPTGTRPWLEAREVDGHLHVRLDRPDDLERTARILAGRAVGLVLGGGGARGFAHIGVIRALREAGVPIDWVGGTSMGSIIAGMAAMELTTDEMVSRNGAIVEMRPFTEFTVPVLSLLRTRRIEDAARVAFGDQQIEDLWLPYFCVSANLTTTRMVVHELGPLWVATRASGALPGITLPVLVEGSMLVDGGVLDNLPVEAMRERCRGKVVAVNVSPDVEQTFEVQRLPSPWKLLLSWISPLRRAIRAPTIVHVMMRTATLASAERARGVEREADLYLRPPVDGFGLLEFHRLPQIVEVGYDHARQRVAGFRP